MDAMGMSLYLDVFRSQLTELLILLHRKFLLHVQHPLLQMFPQTQRHKTHREGDMKTGRDWSYVAPRTACRWPPEWILPQELWKESILPTP